jgi:hypothetical protein
VRVENVNALSIVAPHRYADQSNAMGSGRPGMDSETFLGVILIAGWAAVVLRGLARTILAARKGRKWQQAYLVGSGVGCALGVGVMLSIKNSLPLDTFGPGFLLAAGAGFAIWAFGRRVPEGKRKASIRSKRETGADGLGLRSTRSDAAADDVTKEPRHSRGRESGLASHALPSVRPRRGSEA